MYKLIKKSFAKLKGKKKTFSVKKSHSQNKTLIQE